MVEVDCVTYNIVKGELSCVSNLRQEVEVPKAHKGQFTQRGWWIDQTENGYQIFCKRLDTTALQVAVNELHQMYKSS